MLAARCGPQQLFIVFLLLTAACNTHTRVVPEDDSVRELLRGRDCIVNVFAIGSRTASNPSA